LKPKNVRFDLFYDYTFKAYTYYSKNREKMKKILSSLFLAVALLTSVRRHRHRSGM